MGHEVRNVPAALAEDYEVKNVPDALAEDYEVKAQVSPKKLKVPPVEVPTPLDHDKNENLINHWIFQEKEDDCLAKRTRLALNSQSLL